LLHENNIYCYEDKEDVKTHRVATIYIKGGVNGMLGKFGYVEFLYLIEYLLTRKSEVLNKEYADAQPCRMAIKIVNGNTL